MSETRVAPLTTTCCDEPEIYAMQDVTVWVRVFPDGRVGGIRESKRHITDEARAQVDSRSDTVCATCGSMGSLRSR